MTQMLDLWINRTRTDKLTRPPIPIHPAGPVPVPLADVVAAGYLADLAATPRHRLKDFVRDQHAPDHYIDIAALERDLAAGSLRSTGRDCPVDGRQWQIEMADGRISQGDGAGIDLMYAASMSSERALKPLVFIAYPEGLSMVDGAHRIARALIDGRSTLEGAIVAYADLDPYRVSEAFVEQRA